ncbi:28S ribosomal protein S15, mitochondrial-like [Mya arenaria]|uniref:28S ribosomal protein S15, mitochondrial-like n=1 Tax=Mya arenaria TaxID=6604 RepID=UPI0022E088CD|nr:28S ribosomal protein S15, mitochondrial-like [Mya arenaria]
MAFSLSCGRQLCKIFLRPQCYTKPCSINFSLNVKQYPITVSALAMNNPTYMQTRTKKKYKEILHAEPLKFDYAGELEEQKPLDPEEFLFKYRDIPEIQQLPPHVQKLFMVDYASGKEKLEHRNMVIQDKITNIAGPAATYEREIAYLSVKIRNLIPYVTKTRQNKRHKAYLVERIAKRKKILGYLRQLDYDRYLWMLKELKVTYAQPDPYAYWKKTGSRVTKQAEQREHLYSTMREKINKVQAEIETKKKEFRKEKEMVMAEIDKDIEEYNLNKEKIIADYEKRMIEKSSINKPVCKQKRRVAWKKLQTAIDEQHKQRSKEKRVI